MKERSILFTPENAQKVHEGTKTLTRRILKPQPVGELRPLIEWSRCVAKTCGDTCPDPEDLAAHAARLHGKIFPFTTKHGGLMSPKCFYGTVGDRIYVKESWAVDRCYDDLKPRDIPMSAPFYYSRNSERVFTRGYHKVRSSLFMPKRAARLWLELTGVRVERLHEITEEDAKKEGCMSLGTVSARAMFWSHWHSIHGPGSWDLNPWVWVLTFNKVRL